MKLDAESLELLERGVSLILATRNKDLLATGARAVGIKIHPDLESCTVYLHQKYAELALPNLEETKVFALTAVRPTTYQAIQIKGEYIGSRSANESEKEIVDKCTDAFCEEVETVGIVNKSIRRIVRWPAVAIDLKFNELYIQTPGPRAGSRVL